MSGKVRSGSRCCQPPRLAPSGLLVVALFAVAGCGGTKPRVGDLPVHPVHGSVEYLGEPLEAATVTLIPVDQTRKQASTQGITDEAGEFVLSTYNVNDGAPAGTFYVTVSCENKNGKRVAGEFPELLPERYQSPLGSGLKVTIEDGDNELDVFKLSK